MDEARFDRLENKIDKLTDAVTKIVRVEEQLASNNRRVDNLEERVSRHSKDINALAEIVRDNERTAKAADKFFWMILAGIVSTAFYFLR